MSSNSIVFLLVFRLILKLTVYLNFKYILGKKEIYNQKKILMKNTTMEQDLKKITTGTEMIFKNTD